MQLEYPLYLIPLQTGYVSVVEPGQEEPTPFLAVFTAETRAAEFMKSCGLEGAPRALNNAREFAWLLETLHAPVRHVAFDPDADAQSVKARWKVSAQEILDEHLVIDFSPWNYPVFVVEQPGGFASIEGRSSSGELMRAVGLFTSKKKAEEFLAQAGEPGVPHELPGLPETRDFLESVGPETVAVALDPSVEGDVRSARYCFSIQTVLEKYLQEQRGGEGQ